MEIVFTVKLKPWPPNIKRALVFPIISPNCHDTSSWNPSFQVTRTRLPNIANNISGDGLETQRARVSAAMILIYHSKNFPVSAPAGVKYVSFRKWGLTNKTLSLNTAFHIMKFIIIFHSRCANMKYEKSKFLIFCSRTVALHIFGLFYRSSKPFVPNETSRSDGLEMVMVAFQQCSWGANVNGSCIHDILDLPGEFRIYLKSP